jgi:hypothetical protein
VECASFPLAGQVWIAAGFGALPARGEGSRPAFTQAT